MRLRTLLPLALAVLALVSSRGALAQQLLYIHTDHLNTPRMVTDGTGTPVWRWDQIEPFGDNPPDEDPDGNGGLGHMPLRFPGQYFDKETNLAYNYFRDYDPGIGRYVQSDPIGLAGGLSTYGYVGGSPIRYIDPTGENQAIVGLAIVGAGLYMAGMASGLITLPAIPGTSKGDSDGLGVPDGSSAGPFPTPDPMEARGGKEQGRNWATEEAKNRAQVNCTTPCKELEKMLEEAKAQGNTSAVLDIIQAQKFLHCRNIRKRGSHF